MLEKSFFFLIFIIYQLRLICRSSENCSFKTLSCLSLHILVSLIILYHSFVYSVFDSIAFFLLSNLLLPIYVLSLSFFRFLVSVFLINRLQLSLFDVSDILELEINIIKSIRLNSF